MQTAPVTLADISARYYSMAQQIEPSAMPAPGSIAVKGTSAPDVGRGTLVDTYV